MTREQVMTAIRNLNDRTKEVQDEAVAYIESVLKEQGRTFAGSPLYAMQIYDAYMWNHRDTLKLTQKRCAIRAMMSS